MEKLAKEQIFEIINKNPVAYVATTEGTQPRVRGILIFKADENGIMFHTGVSKDFYTQLKNNPKTEICFSCGEYQIRVSGTIDEIEDKKIKDEIFAHPTRQFLRNWKDQGIIKDLYGFMKVFNLFHGKASLWTMATNFDPKTEIQL